MQLKKKAIVTGTSKELSVVDLLNRAAQLQLEIERAHEELMDALADTLKPYPPAAQRMKAAKARYDAAYAELAGVVRHLNRRLCTEQDQEALKVAGVERWRSG
ncbi:MAG: hypothetical protein N3G75_09150 [Methanothrix sp.]|nr:hypothetical protein [Methanothrix sp.]MCX8207974.1 hypothetical protein [Methanothrix sp.]